jgi:hydroxymethylbilane synthase
MKRIIRVGSRDSALAVRQAEIVMESVKAARPDIEFLHTTYKTVGDIVLDKGLDAIGGKGLFIGELERALSDGRIDIAVHSYKDMPYENTDGLPVVALSQRESPFDALVLPEGADRIDMLKPAGSSSQRRAVQLRALYGGIKIKMIRGNVFTRLSKMDSGEYSALILAEAGLARLELRHRIYRVFTEDEMIPSASQGILAVQGRRGEDYSFLAGFHNRESEIVSKAERQFLKTLGAGCASPVAAYGRLYGNELTLTGMFAGVGHIFDSGDGDANSITDSAINNIAIGKISGAADRAESLGETLAYRLLKKSENI